ncbi:MAG: DUF1385 domain-containing protein [Actinomycetes bacterium]
MSDDAEHPELAPHYYGGQACIEGVMMRGRDTWAVAVRQPDATIWVETHPVSDFVQRHPAFSRPMLRGIHALGDSLSIGMKALRISAEKAMGEEDEELPSAAMGASMLLALTLFIGLFIFLPSAGTKVVDRFLFDGAMGDGAVFHLVESVARIAIFLAYLSLVSLLADIRRTFQYHGAEHKTIAAWEHGEVLTPENVDRYSTIHVRCGTNFLIMVMLLALVVYTVAGVIVQPPEGAGFGVAVGYHVALRVVLLPVVAGLAYEGLRLGARRGDDPLVKALVQPGLWLQRITTRQPDRTQIEVAIRAFEAVVPLEARGERMSTGLPSTVVGPQAHLVAGGPPAPDGTLEPTEGA